ncbi:MAG: hypothetical protein IJS34_02300 [Alphaproteobacteria bacterium]|nr:hypothetical protein [Alphaproteobacteria bacterium]
MRKLLLGLIGLLFAVPAVAADLPAGYTELEYIESTGTQYIDTEVGLNAANKITGKISFVTLNTLSYIAGGRLSNSVAVGYALYAASHSGFTMYNTTWPNQGVNISANQILEFETVMKSGQQSFIVNGDTIVTGNKTISLDSNNIYLFGLRTEYMAIAKVYSLKIYDNNTLVRDFVPAKNSSGVVGMYDTVSGTFFTNAGTGEFVAGPVVPEQQIRIATTAYNSARFSPVVTELNTTIATIRDVVTNTINQTKAIADLQATKQTRPNENCPAGKKCLLVEDNDGQPHWYEIIENAD